MQIKAKLESIKRERGLNLSELFFLAMFRTSLELEFDTERQNRLLYFIHKRFQPEYKFFRFIMMLIKKHKDESVWQRMSKKARIELRDQIRKRMLFNKRSDNLKISYHDNIHSNHLSHQTKSIG
jgi:hypothetical protein